MRTVHLTKREARMLRENLTSNQEGYDYTDLLRLDKLCGQLTDFQGDYAETIAKLARQERSARRLLLDISNPDNQAEGQRQMVGIQLDMDDLNEQTGNARFPFQLSETDYDLVCDKVFSVQRWQGSDQSRSLAIGMVEALKAAVSDQADDEIKPTKIGRRKS